jgi:hypothetical protein
MPGVAFIDMPPDYHFDNSVLAVIAVRLPLEPPYLHRSSGNLYSGGSLLIPRIDIHKLPSQVVYRVSHESSGPGGRRKTGNDLTGTL